MRIPLDRHSAVPLYQQIETYLRQGILSGSLAAALAAVAHGAAIVRVHDVRETVDALKVWQAIDNSK